MATLILKPKDLVPGRLIAERYEVHSKLGSGGSGAVYRVHDRELDETVALKIMHTATAQDIARFQREVRLARRVTHPNAARTYDLGTYQDSHYLTMEYVEGESLEAVLRAQSVPFLVSRACSIVVEVCKGLAAAHAAGVVHRDLKPANILLGNNGRVLITDFGIARTTEMPSDSKDTIALGSNVSMSAVREVVETVGMVGTLRYMAPEQVIGDTITTATDVYALGILLFELLTSELPFPNPTAMGSAMARLSDEVQNPSELVDIPVGLAKTVVACLALSPTNRPPLSDVLSALRKECVDTKEGELADATRVDSSVIFDPRTQGPKIAVLPFQYRGPTGDQYLGSAFAEELVDVLAMTRGLCVSSSGATAQYASDRNPKKVGKELQVELVVDGCVELGGDLLRIKVRLVEAKSGEQLWTGRFEGSLTEALDLQDRIARQVAEHLRVEVADVMDHGYASSEATALRLRARTQSRLFNYGGSHGTIALLEKSLALAPKSKPAIAAYATACVRTWFMPGADPTRDWAQDAESAVAHAQDAASELPETHYAAALFSAQVGKYQEAVQSLAKALHIAPTYTEVNEYLGRLECEAGRPESGLKHLRIAAFLNPNVIVPRTDIARYYALHNRPDEFEKLLAEMKTVSPDTPLNLVLLEARIASWSGDLTRVQRCLDKLSEQESPARSLVAAFCRAILGDSDHEEMERDILQSIVHVSNQRYLSTVWQLWAEAAAVRGMTKLALSCIRSAADGILVDIDWLDHCPALRSLSTEYNFQDCRRVVHQRAEAIWSW